MNCKFVIKFIFIMKSGDDKLIEKVKSTFRNVVEGFY